MPQVRAGFRPLLDAEADIEVIGEAADGDEAIRLVRAGRPDVVLMDIRMPGTDGLEGDPPDRRRPGPRRGPRRHPHHLRTRRLRLEALRAGAAGFLVKDTEPADLVAGVRVVVVGDALLSPGVTRTVIAEFARRSTQPPGSDPLDDLTAREREVTELVAKGLSNEEIAADFVLSPATDKTHVNRAMVKLGARDRAQLVVFAFESGLGRPGWSAPPE